MAQQKIEKPDLLILSSSKSYPVAEGARENLKGYFEVTLWREGFFSQINEAPLNTFLKKLIYFDIAVLIMGPDDCRIDPDHHTTLHYTHTHFVIDHKGYSTKHFLLIEGYALVAEGICNSFIKVVIVSHQLQILSLQEAVPHDPDPRKSGR